MVMATVSANTMRILHVIRDTVKRFAIFYNPRCSSNELSCLSRELMANQPSIRPKCPFEDLFRRLKQRYSRAASQAVWKGTLGKQEFEFRSTGARPGGRQQNVA
jgi:hypothetical protein